MDPGAARCGRRGAVALILGSLLLAAGCGGSPPPTGTEADLTVVAVGDSIVANGTPACRDCTGFVERYADGLATVTGSTVKVRNLSQGGLEVRGLLAQLGVGSELATAVADGEAIIVGIAHNDVPWAVPDDACDGPGADDPDWSMFDRACIATEVERYTPQYEEVFKRIAARRDGKPTILRTINRYNEWVGRPGPALAAEGVAATVATIAAWNEMICGAAEANGFVCADVSAAFNGIDGRQPAGELLGADHVHPSDQGYAVIAGVLLELGFEPIVP